MKPPLESIRISAQGRDQLIKLKRQTGIENWNVLCRWALCCSLREKTVPPKAASNTDGGIEMSWRVFSGEAADIYAALIYHRSIADGYSSTPDGAAMCLRSHLHRGLSYLASEKDVKSISAFLSRWLHNFRPDQRKTS